MYVWEDNFELICVKELNILVYFYLEYLYEVSKEKYCIVIGGSYGKIIIIFMLLYVICKLGFDVNYMVGVQLEGYDCMVKLIDFVCYMVLEGDEYFFLLIDWCLKFYFYYLDMVIIFGIVWDYINVFLIWENYVDQFEQFVDFIFVGGMLIYNFEDFVVKVIGE